ncbi:MAG: hypothetical protein HY369_04880 [Candidatus Aenigmarchaeota archaeon]|nr:hypothetical protein [Candidatus Aenigmarchaeota archaeon]
MQRVVCWDVDRVWYPGISTSYCADQSVSNPRPYLEGFLDRGWFTPADVAAWAAYRGKDPDAPIARMADLAAMLTDFFYELKSGGRPVLSKPQAVEGKQSLLTGTTMSEIRAIADGVPLTPGFRETVASLRGCGVYQAAFSDGLGPFVSYVARREGMDHWGVVPAAVIAGNRKTLFSDEMLDRDDVVLTGIVDRYDKSIALFDHLEVAGYTLTEVAAIDDSAANIPTLKKIQQGGGVAVGFNPLDEDAFRRERIPILRGRALEPFGEIVRDPRAVEDLCV